MTFAIEHIDWNSDLPQETYQDSDAHKTALRDDVGNVLQELGIPTWQYGGSTWELEVHTLHGPGGGYPEITIRFVRLPHLVTFAKTYFADGEFQ